MLDLPDLAAVAALVGDPTRAAMLSALMDGRARTATELALEGGVTASTASFHLARLPESGLLAIAKQGRHRYFRIAAPDVDLVSAHGTGTVLNDRIETGVLKRVLGAHAYRVPMNSIKGALGHTMGAAATLEAIMCLLAARDGVVPSTVGYEEPDPACDLDYVPRAARHARTRISVSTSLGFGGCNAALVLEGGA